MSADVDRYDVEYMIRDAITDLRAELRRDLAELRDDLHETARELQRSLDSLERAFHSRTDHLV